MDFDDPTEPYVLDIVSVTYGSQEYTSTVQDKFNAALAQNSNLRTWGFTVNLEFFGGADPNLNVHKTCIVVYRNTMLKPPHGDLAWSTFKVQAVSEQGQISFDFSGVNDVAADPTPAPERNNPQFIIAAYWDLIDVTTTVQNILQKPGHVTELDLLINVNSTTLGPNPNTGPNFLSITYATWSYPGYWAHRVRVGIGATNDWVMQIPQCFPPLYKPAVAPSISFVTFENDDPSLVLYPQIYSEKGALIWDGQTEGVALQPHTSQDVSLCGRVGLPELTRVYLALFSPSGGGSLNVQQLCIAIASAGPSAQPCSVSWSSVSDFVTFSGVPQVEAPLLDIDRRLNIYSATWGQTDVTEFVRRRYITDSIINPPTSLANKWSFAATNLNLGPDPLPGGQKVLTVTYRIAYRVGVTNGVINDPNFTPQLNAQNASNANIVPVVYSDQFPVLRDVSTFYNTSARNGDTLTIDILSKTLTPVTWPPSSPQQGLAPAMPYIAAGIWSNVDFTARLAELVSQHWQDEGDVMSIPIGANSLGPNNQLVSDPWPHVVKQFTALVGYPVQDGGVGNYVWRTLVQMDSGMSYAFQIPKKLSAPMPTKPDGFAPDMQPRFAQAIFVNTSSQTCWPQVSMIGGSIIWDGRTQQDPSIWQMKQGESKNLDLMVNTAGACISGQAYSLNFSFAPDPVHLYKRPEPCTTGWIFATADPESQLFVVKLTLLVDKWERDAESYKVQKEILQAL